MRIIVNCTNGGASHSMMLLEGTSVLDVKEYLAEREGTPVGNQALLFAGRHLGPDSALLLEELQLDSYSLGHEVVVYMQPQLSQPVRVYLCAQPGTAKLRMFPEVVEAHSTLANIQDLLTERQLSCMPFPAPTAQQGSSHGSSSSSSAQQAHTSTGSSNKSAGGAAEAAAGGSSSVVVKRQDGSCCSRVHVDEGCTIEQLLEALWEVEGKAATSLTFYQARDGCLHAMYGAEHAAT